MSSVSPCSPPFATSSNRAAAGSAEWIARIKAFSFPQSKYPKDAEESVRYLTLQRSLFPKGLVVVNYSYHEEAGEALLVRERITPEDRELMSTVVVGQQNLAAVFDSWLSAAGGLQKLLQERQRLAASKKEEGIMPIDVLNARNGWIEVVRTLQATVALRPFTEKQREQILGSLLDKSNKAAPTTSTGHTIVEDTVGESVPTAPETSPDGPTPDE